MQDEKVYTISLNRKQLREIARSLEACFRMGIGQPEQSLNYCLNNDGKPAILGWDDVREIERTIKEKMGLHMNASWGVGRFKSLDLLYEMYKTIEMTMSWERAIADGVVASMDSPRKWPEMFGCHYDGPLKYTQEPLIRIKQEGAKS